MDREELLDEITLEMIPKPFRRFADIAGIKVLHTLLTLLGGRKIHIPKEEALFKELIRQKIIHDYEKGDCSHQHLADKYGVNCKTVGRYLRESSTKKLI